MTKTINGTIEEVFSLEKNKQTESKKKNIYFVLKEHKKFKE